MTVSWWSGTRYMTHVLQTDDQAFVETMAMNWLMSDQKKSKFVGIVMNGTITVEGNRHDAFILRSRTADHSTRLMAYQPHYSQSGAQGPVQHTIIDFPADQGVSPNARDAALEIMLRTMFGKTN